MSLRTIVHIPDPVLKEVSEDVGQIDNTVRKLVDDMFETMYEAPGIGLAAIQIAEPVRVLTMDVTRTKDDEAADPNPIAMIKPEPMFLFFNSMRLSLQYSGFAPYYQVQTGMPNI